MKRLLDRFKKIFPDKAKDKKRLRTVAAFIIIFLIIISFIYFYSWNLSNRTINDGTNIIDEDTEPLNEGPPVTDNDQEDIQSYGYQSSSADSGPAMFLKVIISLVIIVILIYLTIRIIKFFYRNKGIMPDGPASAKGFIKIIESKNISQSKAVHLVSIAGKYMVLGSSESQLNYISKITSGQYEEYIKTVEKNQFQDDEKKSFKSIFSNYFNNKPNKP